MTICCGKTFWKSRIWNNNVGRGSTACNLTKSTQSWAPIGSHAGACENTNSNDKNSKLCRCWNVGYEHECMYDNIISYKRSNDTRTTCIKTTHIIILYTIILIFCWLVRQIIATVYAKVWFYSRRKVEIVLIFFR
jgi:hypothetical protein